MGKRGSGRPTDKFIEAHFKKKERLNNNTRKWRVICVHCESELTHRNDKCAEHISDIKNCPNAPEHARTQALLKLAQRRPETSVEEMLRTGKDVDDEDDYCVCWLGGAVVQPGILPFQRPYTRPRDCGRTSS